MSLMKNNRVYRGRTEYQLPHLLSHGQRLVCFLSLLFLVLFALRLTIASLIFRNSFPSVMVEEYSFFLKLRSRLETKDLSDLSDIGSYCFPSFFRA